MNGAVLIALIPFTWEYKIIPENFDLLYNKMPKKIQVIFSQKTIATRIIWDIKFYCKNK